VLSSCAGPAGPNCPPATRPGPSWCTIRLATLRLFVGELSAPKKVVPRSPLKSGSTAPSSHAAGRAGQEHCRWTCAQRPGLAAPQARRAGHRGRRTAFEMPFPPMARSRLFPAWWPPPRRSSAGAASSSRHCAARTNRPTPGDRRHVQPRRAAHRHRPARWPGRWTWTTRHRRSLHRDAQGSEPAHQDGGIVTRPARSASRATTRVRWTAWRDCCRWTCGSSTRPGSA
jgi:hypothetical protein